ncbi:MAG TPA: hypothetical protein VF796_28195, partial [Humisphaera sp.]
DFARIRSAHRAGAIDWRLPNAVLAREFEVPPVTVGNARRAVGAADPEWVEWPDRSLPAGAVEARDRQRVRAMFWRA